ncbi:hypothetical protein J3R30DRAFT_1612643 [Lentinula aciculospora]|uniref:Uncharacterized protein n=1 Tax=Lentinula aciculospora TaxID=153920 RepID=A0A9W9DG72_9AGAR|nr:hypothetical protein J3R30DRAFT_1612643 [Lentinula aciculospora]
MTAAGASLITYLLTSLTILLTYFFFFPPNSPSNYQYTTEPTYLRPTLTFLVLCHTLFILYELLLDPPTNLFTGLDVPLSYPADSMRSLLLMFSDDPAGGLPSGIERVLTRLESAVMRLLYVRFGHDAIATCEYCTSWDDFSLYVLPGALWEYICEAVIMGALTLRGTRHAQHRSISIGAVVAAAMLETYLTLTAKINIPKDFEDPNTAWRRVERLYGGYGVVMWHDALLLARRILFLILPIAVHFILKPSPISLSATTASNPLLQGATTQASPEALALHTLQALTTKLQLLRLTRGAIPRNPTLRAASENYWAIERQEGDWIRADEGVRDMAGRLGLGFDEAPQSNTEQIEDDASDRQFLKQVKAAVQNLLSKGYVPSPFWRSTVPRSPGVVSAAGNS